MLTPSFPLSPQAAREALGGRGAGADGATLLAGGAAGVASWASIYPLDVVKSRVQAAPGRYAGWVDCARQSVRSEGWSVLTRGLSACLLRAALVNAAIFGGCVRAASAAPCLQPLWRQQLTRSLHTATATKPGSTCSARYRHAALQRWRKCCKPQTAAHNGLQTN
jgi:hypothetical protein